MQRLVLTMLAVVFATSVAQAQGLTQAQCNTLSTDILINGAAEFADEIAGGAANAISVAYAVTASPDFWVTRTHLTLREIYEDTSPDGSLWDWNIYIARSVAEKAAWSELFSVREDRSINPSRPNIAPAVQNIFSGAGGANTRAHLIAMARRKALRSEQLFATGTGSTASPGVLVVEGPISVNDVALAMQQRCNEIGG